MDTQQLPCLCLTIQLQGLVNSENFWDKGLGLKISLGYLLGRGRVSLCVSAGQFMLV